MKEEAIYYFSGVRSGKTEYIKKKLECLQKAGCQIEETGIDVSGRYFIRVIEDNRYAFSQTEVG